MLEELYIYGDPTMPSPDPAIPWLVPDGQFIPLLTPRAESEFTVLCPRLQRITLVELSVLSDAALLEFILARKGLSRVTARFNREMQIDIIAPLQHLLATGLTLSVEYRPLPPFRPYSPSEAIEGHSNQGSYQYHI
jgi:hypothetical protein